MIDRKDSMNEVVLVHQDFIQHYRVPIYNYLAKYLLSRNYDLTVVSSAVQKGCPHDVLFQFREMPLRIGALKAFLEKTRPSAVILFVNLNNLYLFPLIALCKLYNIKVIYWGHGINLGNKKGRFKNMLYSLEHTLADSIVLYAEHLRRYISSRNLKKVFIANNTLNLTDVVVPDVDKEQLLGKLGVPTGKNILFVGRLQKRKKLDVLLKAHSMISGADVGLVIVGPVENADIDVSSYRNVYKLGPMYGQELFSLMKVMDLYCMPGWVGLSIVDAFFMGLPIVTMEGDHPPEVSYLKDGVNGFMVPEGDVGELAKVLENVIMDDALRERLSRAAKDEYRENATIDRMCEGFHAALNYACSDGK